MQRYPQDYDGVIAGDPANYWTHLYMGGHLWVALAMDTIGRHSLQQNADDRRGCLPCDALDRAQR